MRIGNHKVITKSTIRYLGTMADAKITFKGYWNCLLEKAAKAVPCIRRLLMTGVGKSILLSKGTKL